MKNIKSLLIITVLLVTVLFAGCSNENSVDSGFAPIDDVNEPSVQTATPDNVIEQETISQDDEVEIGELI